MHSRKVVSPDAGGVGRCSLRRAALLLRVIISWRFSRLRRLRVLHEHMPEAGSMRSWQSPVVQRLASSLSSRIQRCTKYLSQVPNFSPPKAREEAQLEWGRPWSNTKSAKANTEKERKHQASTAVLHRSPSRLVHRRAHRSPRTPESTTAIEPCRLHPRARETHRHCRTYMIRVHHSALS